MRFLIFQHHPSEHPGVLAEDWRAAGHTLQTVELEAGGTIPSLERFDLLVAMGGPMDVWEAERDPWLSVEKAAIRRWVRDLGRPFLGICLGHQLLADALGGTVGLMAQPEVGVTPVAMTADGHDDPLTAELGDSFTALHWHGAEVSRPPDSALVLARTAACPIQAFRWGAHAYGIQCHIEITAAMAAEWAAIPEYRASLERSLGPDGPRRMSETVAAEIGAMNAAARRLNAALLVIVEQAAAGR